MAKKKIAKMKKSNSSKNAHLLQKSRAAGKKRSTMKQRLEKLQCDVLEAEGRNTRCAMQLDTIKRKSKTGMAILVVLLLVVSLMLAVTMSSLSDYREITTGEYITTEKCDAIYSVRTVNVTIALTGQSGG